MILQRAAWLLAGLAPLIAAAGCVADGKTAVVAPAEADGLAPETPQPRLATYRCDDNTSLMVENTVTAVKVTSADGETLDLPAAPPGQISRYGQTIYALVLEGEEALYMKGNKQPLSCRR
jgi:membrane-bound inhibitor of C-type lysozyme